MRGGAVAARRAHNPKVLSSNLSPATAEFRRYRNTKKFNFLKKLNFFCLPAYQYF